MSNKIQTQHLIRKAILYVRQSSGFQVQHNEESQRLQYGVKQRLELLGWQEIEIIDEDLGRSASGSVERSGFERMVADVCLGKIGAVQLSENELQKDQQKEVSLDEFQELSQDIERIWNDPACSPKIKKRIVRTLIENVIAEIDHEAAEVVLTIHWVGGVHTEIRVPRRRRGKVTATTPEAISAVRSLARICTDDHIADYLNRNGLRTGRGNRFTRERVISLRSYHKIERYWEEGRQAGGWLNLTEAAKFLGVSNRTLRLAIERGDIPGDHPLPDGPWILQQQELETSAAKAIANQAKQ